MRKGGGHSKGSQFERQVCKRLSLWWTNGERDDVFWRSSQSGGRATQRAKTGKKTHGSYGDIAALDPIGVPLLRWFSIELKCGKSHGAPDELLDRKPGLKSKFLKTLKQAYHERNLSGSTGWLLVCHRDRKETMVYMDRASGTALNLLGQVKTVALYRIYDPQLGLMLFYGCQFEAFLAGVAPADFFGKG